jgi:hypothetical protein
MPTKMKIIRGTDFLQTTPEGDLDLKTSMQMLQEVAAVRRPPADFHILLDLRRVQWRLGTSDIYRLAESLATHSDLHTSKIAVLALPGAEFDHAQFLEICSKNRGMNVDAFTNFEDAIHWFFTEEDVSGEVK